MAEISSLQGNIRGENILILARLGQFAPQGPGRSPYRRRVRVMSRLGSHAGWSRPRRAGVGPIVGFARRLALPRPPALGAGFALQQPDTSFFTFILV